jgi:hypothetical protein
MGIVPCLSTRVPVRFLCDGGTTKREIKKKGDTKRGDKKLLLWEGKKQ